MPRLLAARPTRASSVSTGVDGCARCRRWCRGRTPGSVSVVAPIVGPVPRPFHRPTQFSGSEFEAFQGGDDPATMNRVAHESASALVARVKHDPSPEILDRLVTFTDQHGIDAVAELWARASPHSLPGALWRIYLVRAVIRQNPVEVTQLFERGVEVATTIDPVVAGAPSPSSGVPRSAASPPPAPPRSPTTRTPSGPTARANSPVALCASASSGSTSSPAPTCGATTASTERRGQRRAGGPAPR